MSVKDSELCPLPSVNSLQLSQIEPNSFLVTWDSPDTNMTGLRGFIVAYHRIDKNDQVKKYRLSPSIRGFQVGQISDNSAYRVCVVTRGSSYKRNLARQALSSPQFATTNFPSLQQSTKRDNKKHEMKLELPDFIDDDDYEVEDVDDEDVTLSELILSRQERSTERDNNNNELNMVNTEGLIDETGNVVISDQIVFSNTLTSNDVLDVENATIELPVYPSSNDTGLMVLKPAIVNLGSQSSKCTEIHTPQDPSNIRLIDNKRMSVIIGCIAGLVAFTMIILCIVTGPTFKEQEEEDNASVTNADSLSSSQRKSPAGSKQPADAQSDSLQFTRHSRTNSQSSSIARVGDGATTGGSGYQRNAVGDRSERYSIIQMLL